MKKNTLSLAMLFISMMLYSQSPGYNDTNGNNIKTGMHSNGNLFFSEGFDANFLTSYELGLANPSTIFGAGIWMSGIDPVGNLKVAHVSYSNVPQEFSSGPIDENILGAEANRVWKVTESEIIAHINDFMDGNIDEQPADNIIQWPAKGNNYYTPPLPIDQDLAPFFDADNNGNYDPNMGDYPIIGNDLSDIVPAEMLYTIYNSDNPSFNNPPDVEIHALMYSFDCIADEVLANTIFTRHTFIHRGTQSYQNFKFSFWQDADLGCYTDDLVGCDTILNAMFTYNEDELDGENGTSCFGTNTYGDNPPVHSTVFLNQKMESFYVYYNPAFGNPPIAAQNPDSEFEHYQNMNGIFRDGTPITIGGNGYNPGSQDNTKYAYYDDPNDENGWSMISAGIPSGDPRIVASAGQESYQPGQIFTLDLAHIFTSEPSSNNIETVTDAKVDIQAVQELYNIGFEGSCGILNSINQAEYDHIKVFPNPTSGRYSIFQSNDFDSYILRDQLGKTVSRGNLNGTNTELNISDISGVYFLQLLDSQTGKEYNIKMTKI